MGSNPIAWSSRRQKTLARSSTEAEFRVVVAITTELDWLQYLMFELGYISTITPTISAITYVLHTTLLIRSFILA